MLSYDSTVPIPGQQTPKADIMANGMTPNITNAHASNYSSNMAASATPKNYNHHHIWLVTGPAGCGKTSVAEHLAGALDMPYIEGDSVRTPPSHLVRTCDPRH